MALSYGKRRRRRSKSRKSPTKPRSRRKSRSRRRSRSSKGYGKLVEFRDKRTGKMVRFRPKRKRRRGSTPRQLKGQANKMIELGQRYSAGEFGNMKWKTVLKKYL